MLKAIHAQESKKASREKTKAIVEELKAMKLKEAAKKIQDGIEETLTYSDFRLGNPLAFMLSSGADHDSTHAVPLLQQINIEGSNILGDKAYGAKAIREYITSQDASYTIPPRENRDTPWLVDWYTYKERHLIECFFQKLKWFRRIFTRYDKLDSSFLAFVYIGAIAILLK